MNLTAYIRKRNGVPIGHPNSLKNNLYRSLGARNFHVFWNFWNPIFGYYLGTRIFKPLKRIVPATAALVLTFVFCGIVHDLVTTLLRGKISLFFSVWFLLMGLMVAAAKVINYDLSKRRWAFRALINLVLIGVCLSITIAVHTILEG